MNTFFFYMFDNRASGWEVPHFSSNNSFKHRKIINNMKIQESLKNKSDFDTKINVNSSWRGVPLEFSR